MAKTAALHPLSDTQSRPPRFPKPKLQVCFSFAAYAKTIIAHLHSLHIPILPGLSDPEFTALESIFCFRFPPDLRAILREGLPAAPFFPNWRASSPQQLRIFLNLPLLSLSKNVSHNNFWSDSWGTRPDEPDDALGIVAKLYQEAPFLVPVYRNCYVPSTPNAAGNPVFYIDGEDVRVLSFDVVSFFKGMDFQRAGGLDNCKPILTTEEVELPAWAATAARRIEFWTDVAERGRMMVARADTRLWWWGIGTLGPCLDEVFWRLRDGGWREEEVREMLMMVDGCDDAIENRGARRQLVGNARVLGLVLLRAGWSREDVVDSLDLEEAYEMDGYDLV